jgi:predicted nucleic acid-binding protein
LETWVLDCYALLAFFWGEQGADKVQDMLNQAEDGKARCAMTVVSWGEVYYMCARKMGPLAAERILEEISTFAIDLVAADEALALQAAMFKATHRLSYADAFGAALAKIEKGRLVTGDKEFKILEKDIKIEWI